MLLLLAGALAAQVARAQQQGTGNRPAGPLTLAEAEALFVANNPGLQSVRADARERAYEARVPALWPNPFADVEQERGIEGGQRTYLVEQPVPNPWAYWAQQDVTDASVRQARAAYREEASALLFELRKRYAETAAAGARVAVLDSLTAVVQGAVAAGQVRFEEGAINAFEMQRLRLARASYVNQLTEARTAYEVTRAALARLIAPGATPPSEAAGVVDFTIARPLPYEPLAVEYAALLEQALDQRGRIDSTRAAVAAGRSALRRERASRVPGVSLRGGVLREPEAGQGFVIGLGVEVPLFHRNGVQVQAAQARRQGATAALASARRAVAQDVRAAHERAVSFEERIRDLETIEPQPVRSFLSDALYLYSEGQLSLVELLDAIGAARDARLLRIELLSGHRQARFALQRAIGTLPAEVAPLSDLD